MTTPCVSDGWYAAAGEEVQSYDLLDEAALARTLTAHYYDLGELDVGLQLDIAQLVDQGNH